MTELPDAFCCKERNPVFIFSQSGSIFFLLPARRFDPEHPVIRSEKWFRPGSIHSK
jgi:hypothetical protein